MCLICISVQHIGKSTFPHFAYEMDINDFRRLKYYCLSTFNLSMFDINKINLFHSSQNTSAFIYPNTTK